MKSMPGVTAFRQADSVSGDDWGSYSRTVAPERNPAWTPCFLGRRWSPTSESRPTDSRSFTWRMGQERVVDIDRSFRPSNSALRIPPEEASRRLPACSSSRVLVTRAGGLAGVLCDICPRIGPLQVGITRRALA